MSKKKPPPLHERAERIAKADEEFRKARDAEIAGDTSAFGPQECYEAAINWFGSAAIKFRDLGLGLKAREAWTRSAACRRKIAEEQEHYAKRDEQSRDEIDVLWEGEADER